MKNIIILIIALAPTTISIAATSRAAQEAESPASLISITKNCIDESTGISSHPEALIAYVARVSNPNNQANPHYAQLIKYCIKHGHWSVFEHASMTLKIRAPLAIITQILRHRSFTFQQFSQRYADASVLTPEIPTVNLRRQDTKNRQNSIDDLPAERRASLLEQIAEHNAQTMRLYKNLLQAGVAKECARAVLPQATISELFMTGNVRSWIHYLQQRTNVDTQLEHRTIALACKEIFIEQFPATSEALEWTPARTDQ